MENLSNDTPSLKFCNLRARPFFSRELSVNMVQTGRCGKGTENIEVKQRFFFLFFFFYFFIEGHYKANQRGIRGHDLGGLWLFQLWYFVTNFHKVNGREFVSFHFMILYKLSFIWGGEFGAKIYIENCMHAHMSLLWPPLSVHVCVLSYAIVGLDHFNYVHM